MNTLSQITEALGTADIITWIRGNHPREGSLTVYHDDLTADVRRIHEVRFSRYSIQIKRRTYAKYDAKRKAWTEDRGDADSIELPSRKGEKALRAIIATMAKSETGWPNPSTFTTYPKQRALAAH